MFHILKCSDEKVGLNFSEPLIVEKCDNEIVSLNKINFSKIFLCFSCEKKWSTYAILLHLMA